MNHYTISESDRQELIAALESTGRHNCLAYGVKSLQPIAQAAQPAHAHAIDTSPERVEKQAGNVQVPEGWKLVPVEPTEAMLKAGNKHTWPYPCVYSYKAMLSAAPSTKEGQP